MEGAICLRVCCRDIIDRGWGQTGLLGQPLLHTLQLALDGWRQIAQMVPAQRASVITAGRSAGGRRGFWLRTALDRRPGAR